MRLAIVGAVMASALVVPTGPAYAADDCGEGWFKESDGYLTKDGPWDGAGSHNAWIYHSGKVRFCTRDDFWTNDDHNRRALIGYPAASYPFQSQVKKNGGYTKFCVRQTIRVFMTGVKSSSSWTISGTTSSVGVSYSATSDELTLTVAKTGTCSTGAPQIIAATSGLVVTGTSENSAQIQWVQLTTRLDIEYWVNGTKYVTSHSLVEHDLS